MSACITGWAHSKFGVNSEQTSENMIADVVEKAIEHAEISAKEIDYSTEKHCLNTQQLGPAAPFLVDWDNPSFAVAQKVIRI